MHISQQNQHFILNEFYVLGLCMGSFWKSRKNKARKWSTKLVNVGNIFSDWQLVKVKKCGSALKDSWLLWMCESNDLGTCVRPWQCHQSYHTEPCLCNNEAKDTMSPAVPLSVLAVVMGFKWKLLEMSFLCNVLLIIQVNVCFLCCFQSTSCH